MRVSRSLLPHTHNSENYIVSFWTLEQLRLCSMYICGITYLKMFFPFFLNRQLWFLIYIFQGFHNTFRTISMYDGFQICFLFRLLFGCYFDDCPKPNSFTFLSSTFISSTILAVIPALRSLFPRTRSTTLNVV